MQIPLPSPWQQRQGSALQQDAFRFNPGQLPATDPDVPVCVWGGALPPQVSLSPGANPRDCSQWEQGPRSLRRHFVKSPLGALGPWTLVGAEPCPL